jgi:hypothetical protein
VARIASTRPRPPSTSLFRYIVGGVTSANAAPWGRIALADDFAAHPPALIIDTSTADYMSFGNYPIRRFPEVAALARGLQAGRRRRRRDHARAIGAYRMRSVPSPRASNASA